MRADKPRDNRDDRSRGYPMPTFFIGVASKWPGLGVHCKAWSCDVGAPDAHLGSAFQRMVSTRRAAIRYRAARA